MPPDEESICVYFSFMAVKNRSPNTVLATRLAIRFFQRIAFPDLEPPTDSLRVAALVIGIKKKFGRTQRRRAAITPEIMKVILSKTLDPSLEQLNATQLCLAAAMFVMYFGAMRAEEALSLLTEHVAISASGNLRITLSKGKCNQFKQIHNFFLVPAVEAQALCPVKVIICW